MVTWIFTALLTVFIMLAGLVAPLLTGTATVPKEYVLVSLLLALPLGFSVWGMGKPDPTDVKADLKYMFAPPNLVGGPVPEQDYALHTPKGGKALLADQGKPHEGPVAKDWAMSSIKKKMGGG